MKPKEYVMFESQLVETCLFFTIGPAMNKTLCPQQQICIKFNEHFTNQNFSNRAEKACN